MIKLENVSKFYKTENTVTVGMEKVSLQFNIGEFVAITGESGSGKSTLLNVLSGLDSYEDGELYINGEETSHYLIADWEKFRSANIGFVFQSYNVIDSYTVLQNVMLALEIQGMKREQIKPRAIQLIDDVGLKSHLHHRASKLSGGQKQRLSIARALAKDCPILIADEPTGNLDSKTGEHIIELLHKISKDKLVLMVTHNYDQVKNYVTRKIKMHDGQVIEDKVLNKAKPSAREKLNQKSKTKNTTEVGEITTQNTDVKMELKQPVKTNFATMLRFAFRDLFATPKRLIFSLIVQTVIMTILVLIYSAQMMNINGVTNYYRTNSFSFQTENMVVLQKYDGSDFSEEEIQQFANNEYAADATKYSQILNNYFAWKLDSSYLNLGNASIYTQNDLKTGRLPQNDAEVLISSNLESYYNQTISIDVSSYYNGYNSVVSFDNITVVGVLKDNTLYNDVFVHKTFFNFSNTKLLSSFFLNSEIDSVNFEVSNQDQSLTRTFYFWGSGAIEVDDSLVGDEVGYSYERLEIYFDETEIETALSTMVISYSDSEITLDAPNIVDMDSLHPNNFGDTIYISQERMDELSGYFIEYNTAILFASDFYNASMIADTLDNDVYRIYYPYMIEDFLTSFLKLIQSVFAVVVLLVVGMFGYAIVHWMLRNVMQSKKRDFAIFRSIGSNEKTLAWLVVLEQLLIGIFSLMFAVVILFGVQYFVPSIALQLRYIGLKDYIILFVALLGLSAMLGFRFNKKIFKQSVVNTLNSQ